MEDNQNFFVVLDEIMNLKEFLIVYIEEKRKNHFVVLKKSRIFAQKICLVENFISLLCWLCHFSCVLTRQWLRKKKKIQNLSPYFGRNLTFLMVVSLILNYGVGFHVLRICGQSGILMRQMLSWLEMEDWFAGSFRIRILQIQLWCWRVQYLQRISLPLNMVN